MYQGSLTISKNAILLNGVTVTDMTVVALISAAKPEDQLDAFLNCLQLGARVQSFANDQLAATNFCDQVEASAENVQKTLTAISKTTQQSIEDKIGSVFGLNGKPGAFSHHLNVQLKAVEAQLSAQLDPDKATSILGALRAALREDSKRWSEELRAQLNLADPKSPFGSFKTEIGEQIKSIEKAVTQLTTQQAVRTAITTEKIRGTAKGAEFEDVLHMVLGRIARPRKDKVERTGNEKGAVGASKCGDFTIEINAQEARASGLRIVIEAKNDQMKQRDLLRELDAAMENRGATYGIGISTNPNLVPPGGIPVWFPEPNKAIVHVPDFDFETGDFEAIYIEMAIDVARTIAIATRESQSRGIDIGAFSERIDVAMGALTKFSNLKTRLTTISTTANEANQFVDTIRAEVRAALQGIRDALQAELAREAKPPENGGSQRKSA